MKFPLILSLKKYLKKGGITKVSDYKITIHRLKWFYRSKKETVAKYKNSTRYSQPLG